MAPETLTELKPVAIRILLFQFKPVCTAALDMAVYLEWGKKPTYEEVYFHFYKFLHLIFFSHNCYPFKRES